MEGLWGAELKNNEWSMGEIPRSREAHDKDSEWFRGGSRKSRCGRQFPRKKDWREASLGFLGWQRIPYVRD